MSAHRPGLDPASVRAALEPRRLEILRLLWDRELGVNQLADQLPISIAAVSQHLGKLRAVGLVSGRADGRRRFYRAAKGEMGPLADFLESFWAPQLAPPSDGRSDVGEAESADVPIVPVDASSAAPIEPVVSDRLATGGGVALSRAPTPHAADDAPPLVVRTAPSDRGDEMVSWYRHGLHARVVALEAARKALAADEPEAEDSVRRIASSLRRPTISERFPDLGEVARLVASNRGDVEQDVDLLIGAIRAAAAQPDTRVARILVVEDSRVEAVLYRSIVGGLHREVLIATSAQGAQEILDTEDIDLILLDLTLPGGDGRDLLIGLGRRPRTASIPVVLLTGRTDALTRTEATALGADAFYQKPVDRDVLAGAVSMMLERAAEARQLGRRDPLTGLKNRAVFLDEVRQLSATAARADVDLTLGIIEIAGLVEINQQYGSEAGDRVVRSMADMLRATFRDSDMVARWGGAKFTVLCTNTDREGAAVALAKLRDATDGFRVPVVGGESVPLHWHAGVAFIPDQVSVDDAVARATRRTQMARRGSVGNVVAADAGGPDGEHTVLVIEDDQILADLMRHRLKREGLEVVHYKDGAEALESISGLGASVVVLDASLPGAEGFEVLRRLRESPSFAGIPVLVLTFGSEHDAARAFKLGASDSLGKPFPVEELVARVVRLIGELDGPSRI